MKIKRIRIRNFRAFEDESFSVDSYSCFIGGNGAGKSTVLSALNVFFRETANSTPVDYLVAEDFHNKNTEQRIQIEVVFDNLGGGAVEALGHYVRNGELVVSAIAEFDAATSRAPVRQVGSRRGIQAFSAFFEAYKTKPATTLTEIFSDLRREFPGISDARSKEAKRDALLAFEADPGNASHLVLIESDDQFYGIAGQAKLRPFIQWVYIPAVKDAREEQAESRDGALGKLLARTVRARVNFREQLTQIERDAQARYAQLLDENKAALDEVGSSLTARLAQWSHPGAGVALEWAASPVGIKEPSARVLAGEHGFHGEIARFGHGFQRSYLLALLQELATSSVESEPTLVLGVEEPELYQHPPQARYLSQTLQELAGAGSQVLLTTHSPYFVSGENFEQVRLIRRVGSSSRCLSMTYDDFAQRYANAHGSMPRKSSAIEAQLNEALRGHHNEMFFATKLVLVEGTEDLAYLMSCAALNGTLAEFRRQGVVAVPVGGKSNLCVPLIIAQGLQIPVFSMFDGDRSQSHVGEQQAHNQRLRRLLSISGDDLFPAATHWEPHCVQWAENVADVVDEELRQEVGGMAEFDRIIERARLRCGHLPSSNKNTKFIEAKLELANEVGAGSESLSRVIDAILAL